MELLQTLVIEALQKLTRTSDIKDVYLIDAYTRLLAVLIDMQTKVK